MLLRLAIGELLKRRKPRRHHRDVARVGAKNLHSLLYGPLGIEHIHHLAPASHRADREAAAQHLAEQRNVGADPTAQELLGAAGRHAESGNDLVVDQYCPELVAKRTQTAKKIRIASDHSRDRL